MANVSLTKENIKYLRDAFSHFFPEDTIYSADKPFVSGEFNWENRKSFIDFVYRLTGVQIKSDKDFQNIKKAQLAVEELTETGSGKPESNTLTPEKLKQLEQEEESRTGKIKETQSEGKRNVEEAIKRKEELAEEASQKRQQEIKESLKGKKVVLTPTEPLKEVTLTLKEKEQLFNLAQAVKADPGTVQKIVEQKIQESLDKSSPEIKSSVTSPVVTRFSTGLIEKIKPFTTYKSSSEIPDKIFVLNPTSPLVSISDPNNSILKTLIANNETREALAQNAQALAVSIEAENEINRSLSASLFPESENIPRFFYPQDITKFQIAENQSDQTQKDDGVEINLQDIYDQGGDVWKTWQKLSNKTATVDETFNSTASFVSSYTPSVDFTVINEASSFATAVLPATIGAQIGFSGGIASQFITKNCATLASPQMARMLTSGFFESTAITSSVTTGNLLFNLNLGKTTFSVITASNGPRTLYIAGAKFGEKLFAGYVGQIGGKTVTAGTLGKVGGQIVAKAIPSAVLSKIGAVIGELGTPLVAAIGAAIGWVVGKVVEKINWKKVKEWSAAIIGGVAGLIALPFLGLGAAIGIGAGATAISAGLGAGLGGATLAGVGSGIAGFFGALGGAFLGAVGMPILITFLAFPVVVALLLFIINSGAYVVPPTEGVFGKISSPYIGIVKTPEPPGPFSNNEFPKTITYKVTISAKMGILTNVSIKYDCIVVSSSAQTCSSISNIPTSVDSISPSNPYSFTYTSTYNQNYKNSAIIDTITVVANTMGQTGVSADASASVIFGTPPISCPLPSGKPINSNNYSYNSQSNTGHGSTPYWNSMGEPHYRYPLPQLTSCFHPSDCLYYGYALDVFPNGTTTVYAPTVLGKNLVWSLAGTFTNPGAGYSLTYTDTTGVYTMVLTHIFSPFAPTTVNSGAKITTLFNQGSNTHLHMEFQVNGRWVKPENYFCK